MSSNSKIFVEVKQLLQEGFSYHQKGQLYEAQKIYKKILKREPKNFDALQLNATLLLQNKQYIEALTIFEIAIKIKPNFSQLHKNYGTTLEELKRYNEALKSYNKAIQINPNYLEAYISQGYLLKKLKQFNRAIKSYDKIIKLKPNLAEAYFNRGTIMKELNRFDEALKNYDQAILLNPTNANSYNNRGVVLKELKRFDEALKSYNRAIQIKFNYATAYNNRGILLHELKRFNDAIKSYDKAIEFNSEYATAYNHRGVAFLYLKKFDEALKNYNKAIKLKPNYARALFNKSSLKLLLGEYSEGWPLYEARVNIEDLKQNYFPNSKNLWLGKLSIKEKVILIYSEQGFGDSIQFCRYVPMLKSLNPKSIIFYVQKALMPLLSNLDKKIKIVEKGKIINEDIDFYCPLLSLPLVFKTTVDNIPFKKQYLYTDNTKNQYWSDKLGKKSITRIGLFWSSNTKNINNRKLLLTQLSNILELPFEYHSLQKEINEYDIEESKKYKNLYHHFEQLKDFSDTSALINQMDLVISVDTAVAHLAGALGKKVWILINFIPDFRWLLDQEHSPWYPTAKLFRQAEVDDWNLVLKKILTELKKIN